MVRRIDPATQRQRASERGDMLPEVERAAVVVGNPADILQLGPQPPFAANAVAQILRRHDENGRLCSISRPIRSTLRRAVSHSKCTAYVVTAPVR